MRHPAERKTARKSWFSTTAVTAHWKWHFHSPTLRDRNLGIQSAGKPWKKRLSMQLNRVREGPAKAL